MLNSYGNDMTAANTANAAADAMKKDRLGTPGPPKNDWASQLSTALSSLGSKPADSATSTALPTTNEKLTRAEYICLKTSRISGYDHIIRLA